MAAPTVYTDTVGDIETNGQLFAGKKFWVAQRVPSRNHLVNDIKANGGEIVMLEKKADYLIADDLRTDAPPGSTSYKFVDKSIKRGELLDPKDYPAGPPVGEARAPGATHLPTKSGRTPYTAEEDAILYKWVYEAKRFGRVESGNEIYKQLEEKYPQHTWQSWRDRYLKQLRNRPPSAFNLPDSTPSPSGQSNERIAPASSSKSAKQQTSKQEQKSPATEINTEGEASIKHEYNMDELEAMFCFDDWLELYALADSLENMRGQAQYASSWADWAEAQGEQTAEQWRQYYEKVVRPSWLSDPTWKREKLKKKFERKQEEKYHKQGQSASQETSTPSRPDGEVEESEASKRAISEQSSGFDDERFEELLNEKKSDGIPAAYTFYAREKKRETLDAQPGWDLTALHEFLLTQWHSLSEEERAPYIAMDQSITMTVSDQVEISTKTISALKVTSSSTAQPESPKFYSELGEKFIKRLREDDEVELEEDTELPRLTKRRKSGSATPNNDGTQQQPVEISSTQSSQDTVESDINRELDLPDTIEDGETTMVEQDGQDGEKEMQSIEPDEFQDHLPPPPRDYETVSEDDLPSNTPTPRATRQKVSHFDTQAILASPSPDRHPRSLGLDEDAKYRKEQRSSSPVQIPESDASITLSIEEFRRSLPEEDLAQHGYPHFPQEALHLSSSPVPSVASSTSTGSGDPDPPLTAEEINEFYDEQNAEGFSNDFISAALKRTRLRPELTVKVLDAWRRGKPLPNERGIWSKEDDIAVESGDGYELAKLSKKHTLDGWGGVTERLVFLEGYRSR